MKFEGFIGPSYQSISPNANAQRSVNLLVEQGGPGGKAPEILIGRPGLRVWTTLPTTPVRGLVAGEDRLFAATDSRLYEVASDGTPTELGIIATDVNKTPVQMFLNGIQLFVVSAGKAYIHNGIELVRCIDGGAAEFEGVATATSSATGTVDTSGTAVSWVSGDKFDAAIHAAGQWIAIGTVLYQIAAYTDDENLVLSTSAGTQSGAVFMSNSKLTVVSGHPFNAVTHAAGELIVVEGLACEVLVFIDVSNIVVNQPLTGSSLSVRWQSPAAAPEVTSSGTVNVSGTAVTWVSGDAFDADLHGAGEQIYIDGVRYTIAQYNSSTSLTLASALGADTGLDYYTYACLYAVTGGFLDGYFLAQQPKTTPPTVTDGKVVRISKLYDGSFWDSTDFIVKEGRADSISSILVDHLELYLFGRRSLEIWRNEGDQFSIFQRDPGGFEDRGSAAVFAPCSLAGSVFFLSADDRGQLTALRIRGLQGRVVSTPAVEQLWSRYVELGWNVTDAVSYGYVENGHAFWVINFAAANKTWVFDATTELWHEWAHGAALDRHRGRCHAFVFGKHFIGDWENGKIYESSFSIYSDDGAAIRCQRTAPHLHAGEEQRVFHHALQLDMDLGTAPEGVVDTSGTSVFWVSGDKFDAVSQAPGRLITINGVEYEIAAFTDDQNISVTASAGTQENVPYSAEPPMMLEFSDDDGRTWSTARAAGAGAHDNDSKRVIWRRLGAARDRLYRVTVDSKARQAWTGAILKVSPGAN